MAGMTIRRALARHGHTELVETRAEALARLADFEFDGVVTDVGLPDGSGFDVVREVRRVAPKTPVLVLSGEALLGIELGKVGVGGHCGLRSRCMAACEEAGLCRSVAGSS